MIFNIDEIPILFPYDKVYPEQYEYMRDIKRVLDSSDINGNIQLGNNSNEAVSGNSCILEMPSGTGKTVSLLSITISYQQYHYKKSGIKKKIIYCSRTMSEIEKTLLELENLIAYRFKVLNEDEKILGLGLTSRKNLCINNEVNSTKSGKLVDEKCRLKTNGELKRQIEEEKKQVNNTLCEFHENMYNYDVHEYIPTGVYSFDKLVKFCKVKKICPYFTSRRMIDQCDIIIYSYHYLLDPKISSRVNNMLNLEDTSNTIVIFDEAHNIDNVCIESLSIDLNNDILKRGNKSCNLLLRKIDNMRQQDANRLEDEYNSLLLGLQSENHQPGLLGDHVDEDVVVPIPILTQDVLRENVPGNIRKAEHFVRFLKRFIEYLRTRLKVMHVISETPVSFLKHCKQLTYIEQKPLQFCVERLALLLRTLNIQDNNNNSIEDIQCLKDIVSFATLVSTYDTGEFQLIIEPFELENQQNIPNPILHFICLDPSICIRPVFEKFHTIIITSGTISPLDMYPKILKFEPTLVKSYKMSLPKQSFLPLVISKSTDQQPLTTRFEIRNDPTIVRNYGEILIKLSQTIPDGLIVFFPSYLHMENLITKWQQQGILDKIWPHKIILTETPDAQESSVALEIFKKACDNGKGALLFAVARGKVSEGIDFSNHYARAVILIGIPFQYTESKILKARLEYMRNNHFIKENDWLSFDAMRHASQCLGRVIRGKLDYGVMILCDRRFTKRVNQLPAWIRQGMEACNSENDVDLEVGLNRCKLFLKGMAQKDIKSTTEGVAKDGSVWDEEDVLEWQKQHEGKEHFEGQGGFMV
ncbi:DNA repair helicase [Hanseniaspora valbyensis NRRL Y-1626]|uniref:DNA 5'-3' helicase n=1 Tax=Hanseniaspora valbyensis NRRL Y-1626 TaxID=766949 RepID=A0A1B7TIR2_9ASCO|nr:DNA repair helicase [Hanseniaspora valbyensis NRRL Y-1626]